VTSETSRHYEHYAREGRRREEWIIKILSVTTVLKNAIFILPVEPPNTGNFALLFTGYYSFNCKYQQLISVKQFG
jgi:hypothetical protein